jgi:cytochrome c oxidase subunit 2
MADATSSDALWRWILGGLAAGAIVLGLLVAAYAICYDRGQDDARQEAAPPTETTPPAETEATETTPSPSDLLAAGEELWTSTGCAGCHTIDGTASVGPTVNGLAGSRVELADGRTLTADDAYLALAITDPDKEIVAGYSAGVMSAAVASQDFATRAEDVEALVAYIKAQR